MLAPGSEEKVEDDVCSGAVVAFFFFFFNLIHAFDLCLLPKGNMLFAFC